MGSDIEKLTILNPTEIEEWNQLILDHHDYSFFHTKEWAGVLSSSYGYQPVYFCRQEEKKLNSVIPMMLIKGIFSGNRLVSLPFTDLCEPLLSSKEEFEILMSEILTYCQNNKIKLVEFRSSRNLFEYEISNPRNLYYILSVNKQETELFRSFSDNTKRNIKKAVKDGVTVKCENNLMGLQVFYKMQCDTRKRHGLPPQPYLFFKNLFNKIILQNKGNIWIAEQNNNIISGSIFFHFGKKAIFKYGASDSVHYHKGSDHLIMWEAIKEYNKLGYEELDLGRTESENEGLKRYKRSFNADERIIYRDVFDVKNKNFRPSRIKPNGLYNKIFNKLPVSFLKKIGDITYKYIG